MACATPPSRVPHTPHATSAHATHTRAPDIRTTRHTLHTHTPVGAHAVCAPLLRSCCKKKGKKKTREERAKERAEKVSATPGPPPAG
eukprot:4968397-Prymnesium_polylepis.1